MLPATSSFEDEGEGTKLAPVGEGAAGEAFIRGESPGILWGCSKGAGLNPGVGVGEDWLPNQNKLPKNIPTIKNNEIKVIETNANRERLDLRIFFDGINTS